MSRLVPYVTFRDGQASLEFLTRGLGFELVLVQRDDDGRVEHAELRQGDAVIMGGVGDTPTGEAPGLYLVVDDVDDAYTRAMAEGADAVYPPEDTEWGTRRARLHDRDGYEWTLGTYRPGQGW